MGNTKLILGIDAHNKTIKILSSASSFIPKYLWYSFEYKGVPQDYEIHFTDRIVKFNEDGSEFIDVHRN